MRPLHAWGGQDSPGLYSTICRAAGVGRLTVGDTDFQEPSQALAYVCRHLLKSANIPQIFDAILIDESQDLMVAANFNIQGKQPFFWMADQALRLVNIPPTYPDQEGGANQLKTFENFSPPLQGGGWGGSRFAPFNLGLR